MKMKLTKETIEILKNFASINSGLVLNEGKSQTTVSALKTIVANAEFDQEFPKEFCIYDLQKFLGILSLFDEPELDFEEQDNCVIIKGGNSQFKYLGTPKEVITHLKKSITFPDPKVTFTLTEELFSRLLKFSSMASLPNIAVISKNGVQSLVTYDISENLNEAEANKFEYILDEDYNGEEYSIIFKSDNLKMIPGDYEVSFSEKPISRFSHKTRDLVYYVSIDKNSQYGA